MSELVEALRKAADWGEGEFDVLSPQDAAAAADRIEALERELAEARAELERRARNENRNCLNWGPCSAHDGRMAEVAAIRTGGRG